MELEKVTWTNNTLVGAGRLTKDAPFVVDHTPVEKPETVLPGVTLVTQLVDDPPHDEDVVYAFVIAVDPNPLIPFIEVPAPEPVELTVPQEKTFVSVAPAPKFTPIIPPVPYQEGLVMLRRIFPVL